MSLMCRYRTLLWMFSFARWQCRCFRSSFSSDLTRDIMYFTLLPSLPVNYFHNSYRQRGLIFYTSTTLFETVMVISCYVESTVGSGQNEWAKKTLQIAELLKNKGLVREGNFKEFEL